MSAHAAAQLLKQQIPLLAVRAAAMSSVSSNSLTACRSEKRSQSSAAGQAWVHC